MEKFEALFREKLQLEKLVISLTAENQQLRQQLAEKQRSEVLFADWLLNWLEKKKTQVKSNTYDEYCTQVRKHIEPYFRSMRLTLSEITPDKLERYYALKYSQGLSGSTIDKHHSNINSALKDAVKNNLIHGNPAETCIRPAKEKYQASFLSAEQFYRALTAIDKPVIRTAVFLSGSLGLRRSEVLGLRWKDIDLKNKSLCVQHTVVKGLDNHRTVLIMSDIPKTKSSRRTLPIPCAVSEYLKRTKQMQCRYYIKNRRQYNRNYLEYICVDENGMLLSPDSLTNSFARLMKQLGLRTRFHDLRHPYVKPTTKKFLSFFKFEMAISLRAFLCFALLLGIKEGPQLVPFIR